MEKIIPSGLYPCTRRKRIALGLTPVFSLMNILNFAEGQMFVIGRFVAYTVPADVDKLFVVPVMAGLPKVTAFMMIEGTLSYSAPTPEVTFLA